MHHGGAADQDLPPKHSPAQGRHLVDELLGRALQVELDPVPDRVLDTRPVPLLVGLRSKQARGIAVLVQGDSFVECVLDDHVYGRAPR